MLSIEDTTEMRFGGNGERVGLGDLLNEGQGFYLHLSLVVALEDGVAVPLGVGSYEIMVRPKDRPKLPWKQRVRDPNRESMRWVRVSQRVREHGRGVDTPAVHVCDREADDYAWFESVLHDGGRFVVRQCYERRVDQRSSRRTQKYIQDIRNVAPLMTTRDVSFQSRTTSGGRRRKNPRAKRTTTLEVRAMPVTLVKPDDTSAKAETLQMNLVDVREPNPPEGEDPIAWSLFTTEPIGTPEQVLQVVDAYRARWLIEEYFKALKTGCSYERLQFVSLHALHNALALCLPMAWQMLLLRSVARDAPDIPAKRILAPEQCWALRKIARDRTNRWGVKLQGPLTASVALYAIARLGGHLKRNGPPGWLTLARGFRVLSDFIHAAKIVGAEM